MNHRSHVYLLLYPISVLLSRMSESMAFCSYSFKLYSFREEALLMACSSRAYVSAAAGACNDEMHSVGAALLLCGKDAVRNGAGRQGFAD